MIYYIHKILIPVDLSEASLNALEAAIEIAKNKNALLTILNIQDHVSDFHDRYETPQSESDSINILTALVNSFYKKHGIRPEIIFEKGNASDLILKKAYNEKFNLVVLGTHGASGYRSDFIGSTTYNVVKYSSCPVLIVPPNKKAGAFKKVIFPVRPVTNVLSVYDILHHFLSAGSKLEFTGLIYKVQEKTKLLDNLINDIREKLNADGILPNTFWLLGNAIAENILGAVRQAKADLLVITSAIDVTTKPFFIGPHAQKIINNVRVPVLCVKRMGSPSFA